MMMKEILKDISRRIKPNFLILSIVTTMVIISMSNIVFSMIDNLDKWDDTELIAMLVFAIFGLLVIFFLYDYHFLIVPVFDSIISW